MTKEQFLQHLKAYRTYLPRHTLLTLCGQALAGDVDGAARVAAMKRIFLIVLDSFGIGRMVQ